MEIVKSKVLVLFVVLILGVTCISSINNSKYDRSHNVLAVTAK